MFSVFCNQGGMCDLLKASLQEQKIMDAVGDNDPENTALREPRANHSPTLITLA